MSHFFRCMSAGALSILAVTLWTGIAKADDCSNEASLRSQSVGADTSLSFRNGSTAARRVYWVDQNGARKFYGVVDPGSVFNQPAKAGEAWIVTDEAEKCLFTIIAASTPQLLDVGDSAASAVAPPPGSQQPLSPPAAAPPAIAQVQPAAADQQPVATEPVPQVSPVDQFQLRGLYRLVTQLDTTRMLNSEASGALDAMAAQPEWDSAQWSFEAVAGTPFVRIRNSWKKTYLADSAGKPQAIAAAPDANEAQWTLEPVDGTPYVQLRNRESDRFLVAIDGAAMLLDSFGPDQENNSHWRLAPVSAGAGGGIVATAPPQSRPLYDTALTNCRAVGGIWTGSSCRRPPYMTEPLACARGFVWDNGVGECLWDGGRCPPWQLAPGGACGPNLACRGGRVAPGPRGYPSCYCPAGAVAWGNYPNLTCVPSVARIVPLLVPAIAGGVAAGIISGGRGRPPIGQVFGNGKFGKGQVGGNTPIGTTVPIKATSGGSIPTRPGIPTVPGATTTTNPVSAPKGGGTGTATGGGTTATCVGGTQAGGACICPPNTAPVGSGNNFTCVAGAKAGPNIPCHLGQTRNAAGECVDINSVVTCTGGTVAQGTCGCPIGTTVTGSGTNFQCEPNKVIRQQNDPNNPAGSTTTTSNPNSTGGGRPNAGRACQDGELMTGCNCEPPMSGGPNNRCSVAWTCQGGTMVAGRGCQCPANTTAVHVGGTRTMCQLVNNSNPTTPTNPANPTAPTSGGTTNSGALPACPPGAAIRKSNCACNSPMIVTGNVCSNPSCGANMTGTYPNCVPVITCPPNFSGNPCKPNIAKPPCAPGGEVSSCQCNAPATVQAGRCMPAQDPNCMTCNVKQVPKQQPNQQQQNQQQQQQRLQQQPNQQQQQQRLQQQQQQRQQQGGRPPCPPPKVIGPLGRCH